MAFLPRDSFAARYNSPSNGPRSLHAQYRGLKRRNPKGVVHIAVVRRNGRTYIYRSVRRGGKVTSEYGGSGECSRLIGQMEAIDRDERDYQRWAEQKERSERDEFEDAIDKMVEQAQALARDTLTAAGYH
jgi:hypothetical protein